MVASPLASGVSIFTFPYLLIIKTISQLRIHGSKRGLSLNFQDWLESRKGPQASLLLTMSCHQADDHIG